MKYLFVILTLSGILMQNISKFVVIVKFEMNREYIAKNLCVQKKKKNNCCKGSCQLNKKLKDADKNEQPANTPSLKEKTQVQMFCQDFKTVGLSENEIENPYIPYTENKPVSVSFSVFHPPKC